MSLQFIMINIQDNETLKKGTSNVGIIYKGKITFKSLVPSHREIFATKLVRNSRLLSNIIWNFVRKNARITH